jgi:hypothetical protein
LLHAHCLLIAAIFVPYMALMTGLGAYMWGQVRRHEKDSSDEEERDTGDAGGTDDVLIAA